MGVFRTVKSQSNTQNVEWSLTVLKFVQVYFVEKGEKMKKISSEL